LSLISFLPSHTSLGFKIDACSKKHGRMWEEICSRFRYLWEKVTTETIFYDSTVQNLVQYKMVTLVSNVLSRFQQIQFGSFTTFSVVFKP
jgi:hypothetical protein